MHGIADNAARTGRASSQAQRKGLSSPTSSGWSSVWIRHKLLLQQFDGLLMDWRLEAGAGWCSTVMTVPSLKTAPIPAAGRLHDPLKFFAFAQDFCCLRVSSCDGLWVLPLAWLAAGLRRSALRSRRMAARRQHKIWRL